ncbi:MAG: 50S ribosomal protein L6 [Candidatus Nezhaarchaeota archaeon]|nr:50S ribosomal protein L6 [Candidatus Nezhaarchaeota archaeon]
MAKLLAIEGHRAEVKVPEGVKVEVVGGVVKVRGPLGSLEKDFTKHMVKIFSEGRSIVVTSRLKGRRGKSMVGTVVSHIENLITGVTEGYVYKLKIVYSHFPIEVKVEGDKVVIEKFRGERQRRVAKILRGAEVRVEGDDIIVSGIDLEAVSQTAANIEHATKVKGYDPRVFMDGIYIYHRGVGLR